MISSAIATPEIIQRILQKVDNIHHNDDDNKNNIAAKPCNVLFAPNPIGSEYHCQDVGYALTNVVENARNVTVALEYCSENKRNGDAANGDVGAKI